MLLQGSGLASDEYAPTHVQPSRAVGARRQDHGRCGAPAIKTSRCGDDQRVVDLHPRGDQRPNVPTDALHHHAGAAVEASADERDAAAAELQQMAGGPVSYTHLTLPTIYSV